MADCCCGTDSGEDEDGDGRGDSGDDGGQDVVKTLEARAIGLR